jgi:hypothetical protein
MFRVNKMKVFEPKNPEYALADAITSEIVEIISPKILWWSLDRTATQATRDELDEVYGEKSSDDSKYVYTGPKEVFCYVEFNPILWELSRLGVEQLEMINIFTNIGDFINRNGSHPKPGDLLRISYTRSETDFRNIFYEVSVVFPIDLIDFHHMNWQMYVEQTDLNTVEQRIKDFASYL